MKIVPIGCVRNTAENDTDFENLVSEIEILPEFTDGLYRIEENEELDIIFLFHKSPPYKMTVHPYHDTSQPEVGVFASRSPKRPNFLGLTRVKLLGRRDNLLVVKGLDAFNGTPVVDIKPARRRDQDCKNHK
ncbi:MAG: tRNA (N6-threonylcarbamoyladenosine(37)-N6)-methyltransferase TrmO [Methanomassiliicoccales archaeon]|nr:tRNA (N6-threonylcarbamoyladenosine(37)-N6)-methyltransferase TrmO [Methanomassiliicoccales archaeon]